MADIVLSAAVRNNLLSLQNTAKLMGKTQERLATGLKVNSALDDPNAFFTAASLNARASDLNRLLDTVDLAVQTIKAADDGITSLTKLVESAQALARQALLSPPAGPTTIPATVTGTGASVAADQAAVSTGTVAFAADVAAVGTGTTIVGGDAQELDVTNLNIADGTTITISDGTTSRTFEFDTGNDGVSGGNFAIGAGNQTLAAAIAAINGELSSASVNATVTDVDGGANTQIRVQASNNTADVTLTAGGGDAATVLGTLGLGSIGTGSASARTIAPTNAAVAALTTTNFSVTVGSGSPQTLDLSSYNNRRDLLAALNGLTGVTAAVNGSNQFVLTAASASDGITIANGSQLGLASSVPTNATLGAITAGQTLTIQVGTTVNTITFGPGVGQVDTLSELNARLGAITGGTASVDGSGNLTVTSTNPADSITLGGTAPLTTFGTNLTTTPTAPTAGPVVDNATRTSLASQFGVVLNQITQLAQDSQFNGINLLNGDNLTVIFNEDSSSTLTISGVTFTAAGLGLSSPTGNFQTNLEIHTSLGTLDSALKTLRSQASTFGSNLSVVEVRKDFTKNLINTLETGSANLTLADSNEEGANLLALQTRQQLSSTALSLASQADQNVLRLFQ